MFFREQTVSSLAARTKGVGNDVPDPAKCRRILQMARNLFACNAEAAQKRKLDGAR